MTSATPGIVYLREYMFSEEKSISVLKPGSSVDGFPEQIATPGLDPARQWYLYQEIGPLCHDSTKACPMPTVPKPKHVKTEKNVEKD